MRRRPKQSARHVRPTGRKDEEERPAPPLDPAKARERVFQRAAKLLAARPRSIGELRERLLEKPWADETSVEAAIAKLQEYGYLNDERFAFGYASFRVRQKPLGRQRLARDLRLKKISRETTDEALKLVFAETSEEELINRAIEKRIRLRGCPTSRAETKSLFDHLLRLGFSYDLVMRKARAVSAASVDEDDASSG